MNYALIPSTHYVPAIELCKIESINYQNLKQASQEGGLLKRWKSRKTKRVYYMSRNFDLFSQVKS